MATYSPTVLVQGGAGTHAAISQDAVRLSSYANGVKMAARRGYEALMNGGSAVDAVVAAVCYMEDDPTFNAGVGSCLTTNRDIEMDASVMDGATLNSGAVTCVKDVANPVAVSRLVMEKSDHVMLTSEGASNFARENGAKMVDLDYLITQKSIKRLEALPKFTPSVKAEFKDRMKKDGEHDTVGAVALDARGNLAYATSTGGITAKMPGRVGDSPIPGSGGYADNGIGAVSTTGHGESFMKTCLGKHIISLMQTGTSAQSAVEESLQYMATRVGGFGGAVAIDAHGNAGVSFTTGGMAWALARDGELRQGIYKGENNVEKL